MTYMSQQAIRKEIEWEKDLMPVLGIVPDSGSVPNLEPNYTLPFWDQILTDYSQVRHENQWDKFCVPEWN